MFDAGVLEMLLIGVIALLVIGPERLPGIAAKLGRMIGKARAFVATTRSDIERELQAEEMRSLLNKQEAEIRELRDIMQSKTSDLQKDIQQAGAQLKSSSQHVNDSLSKSLSGMAEASNVKSDSDQKQ